LLVTQISKHQSVPKEKKVLHVIKGLGRGGAERLLVSTIRQHSPQYKFDVVYFLPWKNQLVNDLNTLGCQVTCLSSRSVPFMLLKLPALCRLIKDRQYDLIHGHLPWSGIMARLAGRITKVPVVYTEHNNFSKYKGVTRFFNKLTIEWQKIIIAVSDEVAETLKRRVKPKVEVITILNGVDTGEFDRSMYSVNLLRQEFQLPVDAIIVGTVAVFRPQKRLDRWLSIAEALSRKFQNLHFVIVGDGLLREELKRIANPLVAKKRLDFAGLSDVPERWMACMDIYLMSSDFEGMPVALLEAMSMECVPVVTKVGGIPLVIDQGENGFLYATEDEEAAVAHISELVNDLEKRNEMSRKARKKIELEYGVKKMVIALEEVYNKVTHGGH